MTDRTFELESKAATTLWPELAAFAWAHYRISGRGLTMVRRTELLQAADAKKQGGSPVLSPSWFLAEHAPPGDDYRPVMREYDPDTEILLLVGGDDPEDEALLRLRCDDAARPRPEAAYEDFIARQSPCP